MLEVLLENRIDTLSLDMRQTFENSELAVYRLLVNRLPGDGANQEQRDQVKPAL